MKTDTRILSDVSNVHLGRVKWGYFELIFSGRNTRGAECTVTIRIPWLLWPLIGKLATEAWFNERQMRMNEIKLIEDTLPKEKAA